MNISQNPKSVAQFSDPVASPNPAGITILDAPRLREILTPSRCLVALEETYANLYQSPGDGGQSVEFRTETGKFHVKAGLSPRTHKYFAAKVNANFPENPKLFGMPTIQGLIVLCDGSGGLPLAVLHSGELTGRRTAAATALAAKHGARRDSRVLAMIGTGAQANYQLEAILDVLPIEEVVVYDSNPLQASAFKSWAEEKSSLKVSSATTLQGAIGAADVVVTGTTSAEAIVFAEMVNPGCFLAAVGADNPEKQEIDPQVFVGARIIVDDLKQAFQYGDLAHAGRAGVVSTADVDATLADLAAGAKPGRTSVDEIVIFDSTGTGIQDVAAAAAAYEAVHDRRDH